MDGDRGKNEASAQADYFDLGSFQRVVTTSSKDAQIWFNRGLVWTYAFNHDEAAQCFSKAIGHDSLCAMAYWGLAYTLGPNYNKPWEAFDDQDFDETLEKVCDTVNRGKEVAASALPVEQALVNALQFRYPRDTTRKDWDSWNQAYANAMKSVYEQFPNDLDVVTIFADSLMNITPWKLWDVNTGQPAPGAHTMEVKTLLERALLQDDAQSHPGLLHLYIHLMEMSNTPEAALTVADNLRGLVPDAGHLQHMPSHLDVLCGDYRRAIASNEDAICADEKFFAHTSSAKFYTVYRCHDFHFRLYAAMLSGQSKKALDTVSGLEAALTEELLRVESPPMADWLESFLAMRIHALVRFGRWNDILALPLPTDQDLYCVTTAMIYYGRAIAMATSNVDLELAEKERLLFNAALRRVPPTRTLFNNTCSDILHVAAAMLDGEIEYRQGNFDAAFNHLRDAVSRDGALPYDEPWGWMQPTRHAYGALLLEQGHIQEAADVYSADLGFDSTLPRPLQHPNNVWALHGYHECLTKLGRTAEARIIAPQLKLALAVADVPINASCFCRLGAPA
jgi:tetratricopeptide (TPR) repeat protein